MLYGAKLEDWDYKQDKTALLSYFVGTLCRVQGGSHFYTVQGLFSINKGKNISIYLILKFNNCDSNKKKLDFSRTRSA